MTYPKHQNRTTCEGGILQIDDDTAEGVSGEHSMENRVHFFQADSLPADFSQALRLPGSSQA